MRTLAWLSCSATVLLLGSTVASVHPGPLGTLTDLCCLSVNIVAMMAWGILAAVRLARRQYRASAFRVGAGLATYAMIVGLTAAGDDVHLGLHRLRVSGDMQRTTPGDGPTTFDWGDSALWVGDGLQAHTLVHDRTDRYQALVGHKRDSYAGCVFTRHLAGHYDVDDEYSSC